MSSGKLTALAIVAHPDDIEFHMAGTLLLLKDAGADIHFWNLANGCYGSVTQSRGEIARIRWEEAQDSAREAGAQIYPPICDDLGILYEPKQIAQVAAIVRQVKPDILLVHSPEDYMEDHMNACRLAVTGAFVRGMPNYETLPPVPHYDGDITIYHAMPHGLRDPLRKRVRAGQWIDISSMIERKRSMLAKHRSQKEWLDFSQGMDSYLVSMVEMAEQSGLLSGRFVYAEGWRRHSHLGYAPNDVDPLSEALGEKCWVDPEYEQSLGQFI